MAVSIPSDVANMLLRMSALEDQAFDAVLGRLAKVPPLLYPDQFIERAKASMPAALRDNAAIIAECALALAFSRDEFKGQTDQEIAQDVVSGLPVRGVVDSSKLVPRTVKLLGFKNVRLVAKAYRVLFETPTQLLDVRILSDIRPIFDDDGAKPEAGMIVHELKIAYNMDRHRHEVFFALDKRDMGLLAAALDRALKKDAALSSVLKKSKIQQIEIIAPGEPLDGTAG